MLSKFGCILCFSISIVAGQKLLTPPLNDGMVVLHMGANRGSVATGTHNNSLIVPFYGHMSMHSSDSVITIYRVLKINLVA